MIYGPTAPIGTVLDELTGEDDDVTTIAAPFSLNFFGTKYDGLCITTNGTVSPVLTSADTCSDEYDYPLDILASESGAPVIAALSLDLDPGEDLWATPVNIVNVSIASGIATVTTDAAHGLAVGDAAYMWFGQGDADFENDNEAEVLSVPSSTSFTFAAPYADSAARSIPGATVSTGPYNDFDGGELYDDGFGKVQQVYAGTTTIDGKQAVVITWYRVPNNDDANNPSLSSTFQIVLIQEPTADAATAGNDFTIQYNFGTLTDNEDGYSVANPEDGCDAADDPTDCRWGVGWSNFYVDPDTNEPVTDVYELFPDNPIDQLVNSGGVTAIVNNRLNSNVNGRYTFKMVGGVTVGFAQPTLDGTDPGPLAPGSAPVVSSAAPAAALVVGTPYSTTITATGTAPFSYAVTAGALPTGLTLDPATGTISGTPTTPGSYTYTVTVTNAAGTAAVTYTQVVSTVAAPAPGIRLPVVSG